MSAEKFKNSKFDEDKIVPPKKDYKSKVNARVEETIEEKEEVEEFHEKTQDELDDEEFDRFLEALAQQVKADNNKKDN